MQHRDAGLGVVGPPKAEPALTTSMATALASDDFKGVDNNMIFAAYYYAPEQNNKGAPRWQAIRIEENYSLRDFFFVHAKYTRARTFENIWLATPIQANSKKNRKTKSARALTFETLW